MSMAAIDAIIFAVAAGFAFAVLVTVIVIIGVHTEEHRRTLTRKKAPGAIARLARFVLGWNIRDEHDCSARHPYDDDHAEPLEQSMTTRI
jgi:hypothetical protein